MLFASKNTSHVILVVSLILISTYASQKWRSLFQSKTDEYDMIRNYLLNDSPLYGYDKPKIWIHSKFEYNARVWQSFYSRSSTDLNQPYIHLTIQSIINHCADDFHICLIDDESFSKLIPSWEIDMSRLADPIKQKYREVAMAELVYYYGGMVLPNSTVCLHNLIDLYRNAIDGDKPFVCESVNRGENAMQHVRNTFVPNTIIYGAPKNHPVMKEYAQFLKTNLQSNHFHYEDEFVGVKSQWCIAQIRENRMNVVGGEIVGAKTTKQTPILLEHLMEEEYLAFSPKVVLIVIPEDELLAKHKYAWFAVLPAHQVLQSSAIVAKYLKASIVDSVLGADRPQIPLHRRVAPETKSVVAL
jgi:hypothetical protein